MKFKKKPIIVDAMQLRWDNWNEMCDFAGVGSFEDGKPEGGYIHEDVKADGNPCETFSFTDPSDVIGLMIPTLEGNMIARQNDWVIRGVKGELYPCKPDIFEVTYEAVLES